MTTVSDLLTHLTACEENPPNQIEVSYILDKLREGMVSQIIFDFGGSTIKCILSFYESVEDYRTCSYIDKKIKTHERVNNIQI